MADVSIPREAVEKAARALVESNTLTFKTWDEMNEGQRRLWLERAEVVLTAGAPLIEAAYAERKGKEISSIADSFYRSRKTTKGRWFGHIGGQMLSEAHNIRNGKPRS